MGGFVGFDYGALPVLFDCYEVPENERIFMLDKILILTTVASQHWNTDKAKDAGN